MHVQGAVFQQFSPRGYREAENVQVQANSLTSLAGGLPLPPYSIRVCTPSKEELRSAPQTESIAQILLGDKLLPSPYQFTFMQNSTRRQLCAPLRATSKEVSTLAKRIDQQYRVNFVIDNLPVAERFHSHQLRKSGQSKILKGCSLGFSAGRKQNDSSKILYNHIDFTVEYSPVAVDDRKVPFGPQPAPTYNIVGFFCTPKSIQYTASGAALDEPVTLGPETESIVWTYSVTWIPKSYLWSTRWDMYLKGSAADSRIQWLSILNAFAVLMILTLFVASIIVRTVRRDLIEDAGFHLSLTDMRKTCMWKNLHGDVFRNPYKAYLFAVVIGSGTQITAGSIMTLVFAALGYVSTEYRGAFLTMFLIAFILLGYLNGFVTARLLKAFRIARWSHVAKSAVYMPGILLVIYLPLNIIQAYKAAANELGVRDALVLVGCWLFVSAPLVYLGALRAFRKPALRFASAVNPIPRDIGLPRNQLRPSAILFVAGLAPFSAAFVSLNYVLSSVWQGRLLSMFGFFAIVLMIFIAITAEASILVTYSGLSKGNFRWWWPSFFSTASTGGYLFLYSFYYFFSVLRIHQLSSILTYFGYMFLLSGLLALIAGTIGFYASFFFVQYIFSRTRSE